MLSQCDVITDSIAAQYVARECYDEYMGIYANSQHGDSNFALVAMHDPEDVAAVDTYDVYLEKYLVANVLKFTGMSFDKFLLLPRDRADAILKRCDTVSTKEDAAVSELMGGASGGRK